jgi:hypothetical protein
LIVDNHKSDATDSLKKLVAANDKSVAAIHAYGRCKASARWMTHPSRRAAVIRSRLRRNAIRALGSDQRSQTLFHGAVVFPTSSRTPASQPWSNLRSFPSTPEITTLVKRLSVDPQIRSDEWLNEAAKMLVKKHNAVSYKEGPNLSQIQDLKSSDPTACPRAGNAATTAIANLIGALSGK